MKGLKSQIDNEKKAQVVELALRNYTILTLVGLWLVVLGFGLVLLGFGLVLLEIRQRAISAARVVDNNSPEA
jgi:hypothetical protein